MSANIWTDSAYPKDADTEMVRDGKDRYKFVGKEHDGLTKIEWAAVTIAATLAASMQRVEETEDFIQTLANRAVFIAEKVLNAVEYQGQQRADQKEQRSAEER